MTDEPSTASHRLPRGVVTLLFTDIEGSTRLLQRLGDAYGELLSTHHRLMRESFGAHHGCEVDTEGDAFFVSFASPRSAVAAAVDAQRALQRYPWQHGQPVLVRMGLHTGEPLVVNGQYVGMDVHRAARICSVAHGGQVLISARVLDLLDGHAPEGVTVRDLGHHWLKDLAEPEHLAQLDIDGLASTFPPLKSLQPPTNVPRQVSSLIGRHRELAELRALVVGSRARLVTLTGTGGTGKTRLAAALALDVLDQFPYGAHFVDLSGLGTAELVLPSVAGVLGVALEGHASALEAVAAHIGDKQMLLVLDNFEHVVESAVSVAALLRECPRLQVLVTSRVLLALEDELEYSLPPMSLPRGPSFREVAESEAVQLFVARARLVRRDFTLTEKNSAAVAEVCRLLDGLPLAIQLAAARVRLFSVTALVDRLGDRLKLLTSSTQDVPARHRTLRATVDWSYALLAEAERRFFRDFAVFNGGARLDSIEAVILPEGDALSLVSAMVNNSLLVQRDDSDGEPRVLMLQTLRDYARSVLEEDPAHHLELAERHAQHYLAVVEALMPLGAPLRRDQIARVRADYDNVRAALSFWLGPRADEDPAAAPNALRLAAAMGHYWYGHGLSMEGSAWLERAVARADDPPKATKALALLTLGMMSEQREQLERATALLTEARELYRQAGDRDGEAHSLNGTGIVEDSIGRSAEAEHHLEQAVAMFEELGDIAGRTDALDSLGLVHLHRGSWARARDIFRENLPRDRALGNDWGAACTSLNLGISYLLGAQPDEARPLIRDAMDAFLEWPDPNGVTESLESALGLAVAEHRWTDAARLAGATEAARHSLGLRGSPPDQVRVAGWVAQTRKHLRHAVFESAWREGSVMTHEQAAGYALDKVIGR
ncbi:ATP-binding protein [Nocardioides mesophilus]|uniref:Tetratricopeptide repeat protein n=1 Tax=Nocardioides mesophilus TaxID=433659 RepID=A0A7G9RFU8_9ACTN|nr:tetratricopeptide repeat protein [Nocardioides mesophilus]QNN54473.1 tetratricopeptide repeat protein [Nocardioides mesophilus]